MGKNNLETQKLRSVQEHGGWIGAAAINMRNLKTEAIKGANETNRRNFLKEMKEKWLPRLKKKGVKEGALIEWPVESGRFVTLGKINDTRFMIRGSNVVKGIPVSELARAYGCLDKI